MVESKQAIKLNILECVKAQFAIDYNCKIDDFTKEENTVVENKL